jgi:hypothetical protein
MMSGALILGMQRRPSFIINCRTPLLLEQIVALMDIIQDN